MLNSHGSTQDRQVFSRRFAPKSTTGCLTCKIRRVKCDEGKPWCRRCLSTGRKCDGYSTSVNRTSQLIRPESPSRALTVDVHTNAFEKQAFMYFCNCTAPHLAGYFQDDVWDRVILQLSHAEPAIRHAVNAVSGLHREALARRGVGDCREQEVPGFPMEQYAKALNLFRTLLSSDQISANTLLGCSLLFIHFEALQENFVSAMLHIENITKILHMTNSFPSQRMHPSIVEALARIDIQSSVYLGSRVPDLAFWGSEEDMSLPDAFENINHARRLVNLWTCRMYYFMRTTADRIKYTSPGNAPLEAIWESQKFENAFGRMHDLLRNLEREYAPTYASRERSGLCVLAIRANLNRVLCIGCLYSEESVYDAYLDEFKSILDMCNSLSSMLVDNDRVSSVLLDEELLHPLNFIATTCRDGRIRHEALDQLENLATIRQSWHVEAVWRMVQRCVRLEEGSSTRDLQCQDIPEWRRIHSYGFESLQNSQSRTIRVQFKYLGNGVDGGWNNYEETISW